MSKKKEVFKKLIPLSWTSPIRYKVDGNGKLVAAEDEFLDWNRNGTIINYSGGIEIPIIHGAIAPLRTGYYRILKDDLGGDAPKDFIAVYEYGHGKKSKPRNWNRHIAKVGHKWYPLESISEHLLNQIGEVLGLNMAKSQLRVINGQLRFLSKYFLDRDEENLIHGAQIYSACLQETDDRFVQEVENENLARDLFTFQFTDESIKNMFPEQYQVIMNDLVKLLVFDAIIGNNDRHIYNWAIITHIEEKKPSRFSPIYDSARGLFWNIPESAVRKKFYENKGEIYHIKKAKLASYMNSSRPKIGWEGWNEENEINHFDLVKLINRDYPIYQDICRSLIKKVHLTSIYELLDREFITFYTPERLILIKECLKQRFEILNLSCKS